MSDPERFLTRWSRRKHAANAAAEASTPSPDPSAVACPEDLEPCQQTSERTAETERQDDSPAPPCATPGLVDPPFDPLSLPPIDSIGADTDIRGFLAPGVPTELTRAALRRAWAADPKIRDFVGPADYDWDFNAPGTMAGFGSLEMTDELRRVMAQIAGQISDRERPNSTADQDSGNADPAGIAAPMTPAASEDDQTEPTQKSSTAAPAPPDKNLMPAKKPI
jgi:hypothetical protein